MEARSSSRLPVLIYAKAPRPGRVKTRLAAERGDDLAVRVATLLLHDTVERVASIDTLEPILALDDTTWNPAFHPDVRRLAQGSGDLSDRLQRTLSQAAGARGAVALGADTAVVPPAVWALVHDALVAGRGALGPAADGGFYLLALPSVPADLFRGVPWSSPRTATSMEGALQREGIDVARLPGSFDIDTVADAQRLVRLTPGTPGVARRTQHHLREVLRTADF